jgi:peptidoglycan/LPS O-acetylase OafA/YrhL
VGDDDAAGYLAKNALLWQGQKWIMPFFMRNHFPAIVNGSLWSLFYEAACYVCLGLGAWLGLVRRRAVVLTVFAMLYLSCVAHTFVPLPAVKVNSCWTEMLTMAFHPDGPCVVLAFTAGVAAFSISGGRPVWNSRWFPVAVLSLGVSVVSPAARLVWPLALPYILLCLGERLPLRKLEKAGDISYGIYIYSFIIQQCLYAFGCHRYGFWPYLALSLVLSAAAGTVSWILVEKPCIRLGERVTARWKRRVPSPVAAAPRPELCAQADGVPG